MQLKTSKARKKLLQQKIIIKKNNKSVIENKTKYCHFHRADYGHVKEIIGKEGNSTL